MSILNYNRFQTFSLSEEDLLSATQLSELQKAAIRNNIAGYAHDFINVPYDDAKPHQAAVKQAYYRGCIEALEHLLHTDEEVRNAIEEQRPSA